MGANGAFEARLMRICPVGRLEEWGNALSPVRKRACDGSEKQKGLSSPDRYADVGSAWKRAGA
jgi:hypothetical protein